MKILPYYLGWSDRKLNIIHSKLRNMCSSLSADLLLVNLNLILHVSVVMDLKIVYIFNVLFTMKIKQFCFAN